MRIAHIFICVFLFSLLVFGCVSNTNQSRIEEDLTPVWTISGINFPLDAATETLTPFTTEEVDASEIPSETPVPALLPTLEVSITPPIVHNTAQPEIPDSTQNHLNDQSILQLTQLSTWGRGVAEDVYLAAQHSVVVVKSATGVFLYRYSDLSLIAGFEDVDKLSVSPGGEILAFSFLGGKIEIRQASNGSLLNIFGYTAEPPRYPPAGFDLIAYQRVQALTFSSDSTRLAVGFGDRSIYIWDPQNGTTLMVLRDSISPAISQLTFSQSGRYLLSTGIPPDSAAGLWNLESERLVARIPRAGKFSNNPFHPNEKSMLSTAFGGFILIWELPYGTNLRTLSSGMEYPSAEYSDDGKYIVLDGGVQVRRLTDGRRVTLEESGFQVFEAPAPHLNREQLWSLEHLGNFDDLQIDSEGNLSIIGHQNDFAYLWQPVPGNIIRIKLDTPPLGNIIYEPNQGLVEYCTSTGFQSINLSDSQRGNYERCRLPAVLSYDAIMGTIMRSSSIVIDVLAKNSLNIIDQLRGHNLPAARYFYSSDGRYFATASNAPFSSGYTKGELLIWRKDTFSKLYAIPDLTGAVVSGSFSFDGGYFAASDALAFKGDPDYLSGKIRIWRLSDGWQIRFFNGVARSLLFSPGGDFLIGGTQDGKIKIWSAADGALMLELDAHKGPIIGLKYSKDYESIYSMSEDGTIKLWGLASE